MIVVDDEGDEVVDGGVDGLEVEGECYEGVVFGFFGVGY